MNEKLILESLHFLLREAYYNEEIKEEDADRALDLMMKVSTELEKLE